MLNVVLTILKIIGIVLLVILALVIALLLIVLFVPIRYSAHVVKEEPEPGGGAIDGLRAEAKVTWLLHLISFRIGFADKKLSKVLKVFGIDLSKKKKEKPKKKKKKVPKEGEERPLSEIASGKKKVLTDEELDALLEETAAEEQSERPEEVLKEPGQADTGGPEEKEPEQEEIPEPEETDEEDDAPPEGKQERKQKAKSFSEFLWRIAERVWKVFKKIAAKIRSVVQKIKAVLAKIKKWIDFLADERTQAALVLVLKEVGGILKGWLPKKIRGYVRFGEGDPYRTGERLAYLAACYPLYGRSLSIYPDFENKTLEGDVELKGRIVLAAIVGAGLKLILNKNVKYVIGFMKNKEEQHNGGE